MRMRSPRALLIGLLALAGCQEPPDISGEIETYANLLTDTTEQRCMCSLSLGYDSLDACWDDLGTAGITERNCLASALEGNEDTALEHLSCVNAALESYKLCAQANANGDCDADVDADCGTTYAADVAACPQLPAGVQGDFAACTAK